jgi:enoyl-CoA hydratase/carnithine racemase
MPQQCLLAAAQATDQSQQGDKNPGNTMTDAVLNERRGRVDWIIINRPEQRNAVNDEVLSGIRAGLQRAAADPEVRAVVLTGAGNQAFCAGADLKQAERSGGGVFKTQADTHPFIEVFRAAEACNKPIIARVNGHAMAGGIGLLCMCDLAIAVDHARFGVPEARIGVFPMMILGYMLRLIPRRKLLEMSLTAEPFPAGDALEYGLLNRVVPASELDAAVDSLLERILGNSPMALLLGKKAFHAMQDMSLPECFEYAQLMIARMSQSEDAREGMAAFVEKRPPNWP